METTELVGVLAQLQHDQQLVRSKGQRRLQELLESGNLTDDQSDAVRNGVVTMLASDAAHARLGGFLTATLLLPYLPDDSEFLQSVERDCVGNLEHPESRIRRAVGDCLGTLAKLQGGSLYASVGHWIRDSIVRNFERDEQEPQATEEDPLECLLETSYRVTNPGSGEMRHGTEGWKSLETSYRALLKIVESTGAAFEPYATPELWNLVFRGVHHPNRFVREISYFTIGALVESKRQENEGDVAKVLAKGLGDDWSQVRYAASVATRSFMSQLQDAPCHSLATLYPQILPQMCLNRYYVAEGVRLYSQETWKLIVGEQGRERVAQFAGAFVEYYVRQCGANNHAVREAACGCIAELMTKIEASSIEAHVPRLIQALVNCFKDASWPVRDAACCACGKCVLSFPGPSRTALEELYTLWLVHLADNIASVREDSAVALGDSIRAYGSEALERILPEIREMIMEARQQEPDSTQFSNLQNATQFGVAEARREGEDAAHTDQTMFSCGSLAPKLARGGGCMDHGFKRPKQPWEVSDGAVYFVRELSAVHAESCLEFIPALVALLELHHFTHAHNLHETVWKVLPAIARNIGKRIFKKYLKEMLNPLFKSLQSGHQLEEAAALKALMSFSQFLGEGIFRGRLNERQNQILDSLSMQNRYL